MPGCALPLEFFVIQRLPEQKETVPLFVVFANRTHANNSILFDFLFACTTQWAENVFFG